MEKPEHGVQLRFTRDVYSLGVLFYELLTGERPFQGRRRLALLQVLEEEPRPPRALNEHIPKDLETICLKAMAKSRNRRYSTAAEFAADLRRFLDGEAIAARPVRHAERLWRWCRKYPLAAAVMVAVVTGSAVLSHLSNELVQETALDGVRREADLFEGINVFYSEIVVGRRIVEDGVEVEALDRNVIQVTHRYAQMKNALPAPKTLTIDSAEMISAGVPGMEVRFYSDHPWRDNGGPKNDFERTALDRLRAQATREGSQLEYREFRS